MAAAGRTESQALPVNSTDALIRVLVIDDDPSLLITLAECLDVIGGFEVKTATNGVQGLEQVVALQPDCVVVDVRMPGLNGYQFVRALRGDPETDSLPIIVLSALVQGHEQLAGLLTGADAYLLKPVRVTELVEQILRLMRTPPTTREMERGSILHNG